MQKQNNRNAWKLVGMYVQITLSALWIIHKCLEVSVKCHYEATWQDIFFSYQFSHFRLESVWLALLGLGNGVNTVLRLLLRSTKQYRSCVNMAFSFLFHWQVDVLALFYFFFKITFPEPDNINLHLYSIGQPVKKHKNSNYIFGLHLPES